MSATPRKTQKVFGSSLVPAGNVAVFGSLASGAPAYSNDPAAIQSLAAFLSGLNGAVVGNRSPAIEDLNALFLLFSQQIAYLLESGLPEWDTDTTYWMNQFVRVGGTVYVSLSDANSANDPTTSTGNWQPYRDRIAPAMSTAKAWVNFNGTDGTILSGFNVSSVVRTAAGTYTINFGTAMADANYAVIGSAGPANGGTVTSPAGNNNGLCRFTTTTTAAVSVWLPKPDQTFGEDAGLVSVMILGN